MAERPAARPILVLFSWYWLPVLMYVGVILSLSAQADLQPPMHFANADKVCHLLEYGGLGVLLARAFRNTAARGDPLPAAIMAVVLGVIVGASDEIFQSFVPGRQSSLYDVLADATGVVLAQILYLLVARE